MPKRFLVVGTATNPIHDHEFRALAKHAVDEFGREPTTGEAWERFAERLSFVGVGEGLEELKETVEEGMAGLDEEAQLLHYLSVPPKASRGIIEELGMLDLARGARVIMEKPFGVDLASARELNETVHRVFDESQVFRIDHFLGKEAVQNLLALRFANGMFEPIWNRDHIDHVQIDVPETLSIGMRAKFYEATGAFRDMVVTHLFQVLGFVAMEPPTSLQAKQLVSEKTKVFDSMRPLRAKDVVRGQYEGYREVGGVARDSQTETFAAVKVSVDNWRWSGVPFFLRTGKRMHRSGNLLTVALKQPPRRMFPMDSRYAAEDFGADHLTFELEDPGTISANFLAKVPGPTMKLGEAYMDFSYAEAFGGAEQALAAYERLIHDVMMGDRTLFTTADGIERLWELSQEVLENPPPLRDYAPGSWGPDEANELIAPRRWHLHGAHP